MKSIFCYLLMFLGFVTYTNSVFADDDDYRVFHLLFEDIELREGVSSDIRVTVFVNEDDEDDGTTVLAIHGFAHTAATWELFAEELLERSEEVSRLVAIDLPGRGGSRLTAGTFGELTLDDYITAIDKTLEGLPRWLKPSRLIAHSQGALLVQMMQDRLLLERKRVRQVVLLAPVPATPIPWSFSQSSDAQLLLQNSVQFTDELGLHVAFSNEVWINLFFGLPPFSGTFPPGTPPDSEVEEKGYNALEPFESASQLLFLRPSVSRGIFKANKVAAIAFEQDVIVRPNEIAELYDHLTATASRSGYVLVKGDEAVHDAYISDPGSVVEALCAVRTLDCDD